MQVNVVRIGLATGLMALLSASLGCGPAGECETSADCPDGEQCVIADDGSRVCEPEAGDGDGDGDGDQPGPCDFHDDCGEGDGRPSRRSELTGIYDPVGQRMITFGGHDLIPVQCGFVTPGANAYQQETWAFEERCGIWKRIGGFDQPPARSRHMMAYDPAGQRALMFGGRWRQNESGPYTLLNDLWELDLTTDTWTQLNDTNPPSGRVNAGFVINDDGTKAYIVAGNSNTGGEAYTPLQDVWELDLNTLAWTERTPAGGNMPEARLFVGALYDPGRDLVVIHGGGNETAFFDPSYYADLWAFDVNAGTWSLLHAGTGIAPAGRFWGELVYEPESDRYMLFGGHDGTNLGNSNDLWAFDPVGASWQPIRIGDTYNRPALDFCDFPPDFTNVDEEAPERRNAHIMVYSSYETCPGILISMGKSDCGAVDDVWRWSVDDNAWQELSGAREGEMCLRKDTLFDCFEMCE